MNMSPLRREKGKREKKGQAEKEKYHAAIVMIREKKNRLNADSVSGGEEKERSDRSNTNGFVRLEWREGKERKVKSNECFSSTYFHGGERPWSFVTCHEGRKKKKNGGGNREWEFNQKREKGKKRGREPILSAMTYFERKGKSSIVLVRTELDKNRLRREGKGTERGGETPSTGGNKGKKKRFLPYSLGQRRKKERGVLLASCPKQYHCELRGGEKKS